MNNYRYKSSSMHILMICFHGIVNITSQRQCICHQRKLLMLACANLRYIYVLDQELTWMIKLVKSDCIADM